MTASVLLLGLSEAADSRGREDDMWLAIVVLGLIVIVFTAGRLLGRMRRAKGGPAGPAGLAGHAEPERPKIGRVAAAQLEDLLKDIEGLAREMNARLDTRIKALEVLIRQADERIALLGGRPEAEPDGSGRSDGSGASEEPEDESAREICRLADDGLSVEEISRRTGALSGEVELILGLRRERDGGSRE